ncbi:MAG: DUF1833 domain-containing protein [Deltaproteobacteria bacterium]|jgi:hypothetical protein|nr:DUF1833 domain-containing protein [Deltaproteobacteria bacterium]
MDDKMKAALAEAYASAPQNTILLHTLEVNHRSFTEPARVCRWSVTGPEPEVFHCQLEDNAPYNPGQVVDFIGLPFEITLPEKDTESPGQFTIKIDNIGDRFDEYLENAALHGGTITAIYRVYRKGFESSEDGPDSVYHSIKLHSPRQEGQAIVMDGAVLDWMFKKFGKLYLAKDYPGLVAGR